MPGLKAQSVDSGLPVIFGRDDVEYVKCSDEHGVIADPDGVLKVNDKLRLVPGHCDPTCNVHDWYVGVRNGKVETSGRSRPAARPTEAWSTIPGPGHARRGPGLFLSRPTMPPDGNDPATGWAADRGRKTLPSW
jgi:hypothetical protein